MATPNYGYEKRQRELAKKKKKEEKLKSKTQRRPDDAPEGQSADDALPETGETAGSEPPAGAAAA